MATVDPPAIVVLCTAPDAATAKQLAHGLVQARLAACVNIIGSVQSCYRWNEAVQEDTETQLIIKTSSAAFEKLEAWMTEHHPYDVPELVGLPVATVGDAYWQWMQQNIDSIR